MCTDVCWPRPANFVLCCERGQPWVVSWLEAAPPCSQVISELLRYLSFKQRCSTVTWLTAVQTWQCVVTYYLVVQTIFMPLPPNSFGEVIMFSDCPSTRLYIRSFVCPFVPTDIVSTISQEWLEQFWYKTNTEYSIAPTDDLIRFWRRKLKVTAGRRDQALWTPYLMKYLGDPDET